MTRSALGVVLALALGCSGGRSLPPPVGYPDADDPPEDVYRRPDAIPLPDRSSNCGGTVRNLSQSRAEMLLVIDRSNSMRGVGSDGRDKWNALLDALRIVLPRVEEHLSIGLVVFPRPQRPDASSPPVHEVCGVLPTVDVAPAFHNAPAVRAMLSRFGPGGATPTQDALLVARNWLRDEPDPLPRRFLVLATDGGPNCNTMFDHRTCRCTGPDAICRNEANPYARANCLDDARTVETLRALAGGGIQTFVIGLPGVESLTDVLDAMAVAGGRARAGAPRYYSATSTEELTRALNSITSGLIECRFRLDAPPPDPSLVDVRLNGISLVRDRDRRDGWDWADETHTEILFFGETCDRVRSSSGGTRLAAAFGCPAPVPP